VIMVRLGWYAGIPFLSSLLYGGLSYPNVPSTPNDVTQGQCAKLVGSLNPSFYSFVGPIETCIVAATASGWQGRAGDIS
jgi:hypothetical protein